MKLQNKYAVYNAVSKIIIVLVLGAFLPVIIDQVAYHHIDTRLKAKKKKIYADRHKNGLDSFFEGKADATLGSYNLLKEEFISLEKASDSSANSLFIRNTQRIIDDEVFDFRVLSSTFKYNNQYYLMEVGESLSTINSLKKILTRSTILLLVIAIIIAFIMDISFTQYLLTAFNSIIENKLRLAQHPSSFNFERVKTTTKDFDYLDQSINDMMHKIQDAFKVEKEFIANVSHELLTPISILQNRFENLIADEQLDDAIKIKLMESQKTISRLSKIIKTLLLISKVENEQYLKEDTVSIEELVREVSEEIEDRFVSKNITLSIDIQEPYQIVGCNKSLLFMMIFNLMNNAIKYNVPSGHISILGKTIDGNYVLRIRDTGVGIPIESLKSIFNRFHKGNQNEQESYGLGLPIVKTIAEFHKIDINVQSTLGKESSFYLIFRN